MTKKTRNFEEALLERLTDREYAVDFLNAVLFDNEGDPSEFLAALRLVAKARNISMSRLAEDTSLGRQALYRSLSENGNPELATLTSVLRELGLRLAV